MIGWILVLCVIVYAAIKYESFKKRLKYFQEHGIAHIKPTFLVGNLLPLILKKKHSYHIMKEQGKQFSNDKYFGFFEFLSPIIVITDADLIKELGVRHFNNFINRRKIDFDILERDVFTLLPFLLDDEWRKVRVQSESFFARAKYLDFYPLLMEHLDFMMKYLEKIFHEKIHVNDKGNFELNNFELAEKYTVGIIASLMYGEVFNTFENENIIQISRIKKYALSLNNYGSSMKLLAWILFPKIMYKLKIRVFPIEDINYIFNEFSNAIDKRLRENNIRTDCCQTVADLINKTASEESSEIKKNEVSEEIIYKLKYQVLSIVFGGVDTSTSIISSLLYELTKNKEVQNKLREEIDSNITQHGEIPSWEVIGRMQYLEMVVAEVLRKWPQTLEVLQRCCNKDTVIEAPREGARPYLIRKGDAVWLSTVAVHYSEKYWKNPDIFDPERFNEVNRPKIYPYSYIPFGVGPRACIAYRLAPMFIKNLAFHLLAKYELVKTENFNENLDYLVDSFTLKPESCNIGMRKRLDL